MGGSGSTHDKEEKQRLEWESWSQGMETVKEYPKIYDISDKEKIGWGGFGEIYKWDEHSVLKVIKGNEMQKEA